MTRPATTAPTTGRQETAVPEQTDTQTPPLPAPGAPHAYVAVQRTHSPHADRPEWHHRAKVIPAWDADDLAYARRCGDTLLPIGPDGDTGTRWVTEEPDEATAPDETAALRARVAELEARTAVARPDAKNPTRPLIRAAYIAQDDISKPPEPWAIRAAADVVNAYIDITERVAAEEARHA